MASVILRTRSKKRGRPAALRLSLRRSRAFRALVTSILAEAGWTHRAAEETLGFPERTISHALRESTLLASRAHSLSVALLASRMATLSREHRRELEATARECGQLLSEQSLLRAQPAHEEPTPFLVADVPEFVSRLLGYLDEHSKGKRPRKDVLVRFFEREIDEGEGVTSTYREMCESALTIEHLDTLRSRVASEKRAIRRHARPVKGPK